MFLFLFVAFLIINLFIYQDIEDSTLNPEAGAQAFHFDPTRLPDGGFQF